MTIRNRLVRKVCGVFVFSMVLSGAAFVGDAGLIASAAQHKPEGTLSSFQSDAELRAFLLDQAKHLQARTSTLQFEAMPPPPPPPPAPAMASNAVSVASGAAKASGITNNQEAGVDEGDIVKESGDMLIMLRRGRLFTVSIAGGAMHPIDSIAAYPPGVDPSADWYDELLVSGDRIIVIGYSYGRGGTQVNRFHLDGRGRLSFTDAYQLRSNDYYSSRNYASRLIGHELVFYSPLYLPLWSPDFRADPLSALPALRRWSGTGADPGFHRIVSAQHVYIARALRNSRNFEVGALHTVTTCDVSAPDMNCTATSVFGPDSRTFYVSGQAVYVWSSNFWSGSGRNSPSGLLYRLPLDGSAPSAVGVRGTPTDQFAFREDADEGALRVLVRSEGGGDAMWNPEFSNGSIALLRVAFEDFGNGSDEVGFDHYRVLPNPGNGDFHERFVGNYILYGVGNGWGAPHNRRNSLYAVRLHGGPITDIALSHGVDRIEQMGRNAVVVGGDEKRIYFSSIELAAAPRLGDVYSQEGAQAETRSHGFYFNPDEDDDSGVLGLPVTRPGRPAYKQLTEDTAAVTFLRRADRHFAPLGELAARGESVVDDQCKASCVDWYGNARPIFYQGRVFALMGYELVEGRLSQSAIAEVGRVNYLPHAEDARRVSN